MKDIMIRNVFEIEYSKISKPFLTINSQQKKSLWLKKNVNSEIGATDGSEDEAPVGAPVPAGAFSSRDSPAGSPASNDASGLQIFSIAGVALEVELQFRPRSSAYV